ncbi:MAG: inositol monophosphatase family protein [Candidatus Kapaibacteriales bacterium]
MNLERVLSNVQKIAYKAGDILLEGFGKKFEIFYKEGKNNLVTKFDHLSEEFIISSLKKIYPDSFFLAEESNADKSFVDSPGTFLWVIDPLDGTVNYAHNLPIYSVSIALIINREIVLGVIFNPNLNEMFYGIRGQGAFLNRKKIRVSSCNSLDDSFLVTGFPYNIDSNPGGCINQFVSMLRRGIPVRRLGSAALDLAYVSAGRFDGFWEINLKPWDTAAGVLLVEEAGGMVSQYSLEKYSIFDNNILATNGFIHNHLAETLTACYLELKNGS